jgi:hypothetical protein
MKLIRTSVMLKAKELQMIMMITMTLFKVIMTLIPRLEMSAKQAAVDDVETGNYVL